jgi:N-acetylmuramoyl-L-alanine amidase
MFRREILQGAQRIMAVVVVIAGLGIFYAAWLIVRPSSDKETVPSPPATVTTVASRQATVAVHQATATSHPWPTATSTPHYAPVSTRVRPTVAVPRRIGIVSGHRGYDPGAICADGLTEAEINFAVAQRVVALLERMGYVVELLDEYDDRLEGYQADALVSIHADSCDVPGASGFKVARVLYSAVPEVEDRLVECLRGEYAAATGLHFHANSITFDMREYHAFNEIAPKTPGAIIEIGFMGDDRYLLLFQQDRVAKGIVDGLVCFLEGE